MPEDHMYHLTLVRIVSTEFTQSQSIVVTLMAGGVLHAVVHLL